MDCTPQTINLAITSNDSNVSGKTLDLYPVEVFFILIGSRDLNLWLGVVCSSWLGTSQEKMEACHVLKEIVQSRSAWLTQLLTNDRPTCSSVAGLEAACTWSLRGQWGSSCSADLRICQVFRCAQVRMMCLLEGELT